MGELENEFAEIVRCLFIRSKSVKSREKEYLKAVQIASWVKQKSSRYRHSSFDKSTVSNVLSHYKYYFDIRKVNKYANEYAVKWELIQKNYAKLIPGSSKSSSATTGAHVIDGKVNYPKLSTGPKQNIQSSKGIIKVNDLASFCDEARQALTDEYKQAEEILLSNPVIVQSYKPIDQSIDPIAAPSDYIASRIYEANLEYRIVEAPPIPEGVPVRVRWHYPGGAKPAKLLQWDLLNSKAYLAFSTPLDNFQCNNQSRIELTTHELIKPLADNLNKIKTLDELVLWKLLSNNHPQQLVVGREETGSHLDKSQSRAVHKAIENDYTIIWGPPGTGKTHTIGCLICELVLSGKRVLATSISNVAVDNMAIKFVKNLLLHYPSLRTNFDSGKFIRFGYTRNDELSNDLYRPLFSIQDEMSQLLKQIRQIKRDITRIGSTSPKEAAKLRERLGHLEEDRMGLSKRMVADAEVVFTTAAQVYINSAFEAFKEYDVVVIDEVSMMAVPTFSVVAARSKSQTVVVGDFRQLAPIAVSHSAISDKYLHNSPFEWLNLPTEQNHSAMEMLQTQRRMAPKISHWVSKQFYKGVLEDDPVVIRDYIVQLPSDLPSQLVLLDLSNSKHKTDSYNTKYSVSHSRFNIGSAEYIIQLAVLLKKINPGSTIAVISTYREQAHILHRELEKEMKDSISDIQVGTVHTFQGSEADIVIWDTVDTSEKGLGQPYRGDQGNRLTNVAVSRARKLMIVACDRSILKKVSAQTTTGKFMELLRDVESCEKIIDKWIFNK